MTTALSNLQKSALYATHALAQASTTLLIAELACSAAGKVLNYARVIGENRFVGFLRDHTPTLATRLVRTYTNLPTKELAIATLVSGTVACVCAELIARSKGKNEHSFTYNKVVEVRTWLAGFGSSKTPPASGSGNSGN